MSNLFFALCTPLCHSYWTSCESPAFPGTMGSADFRRAIKRCLSDKERLQEPQRVCRRTAALFTDMLCFCLLSLRRLMACQSFPVCPDLCIGYEITVYIYSLPCKVNHMSLQNYDLSLRCQTNLQQLNINSILTHLSASNVISLILTFVDTY